MKLNSIATRLVLIGSIVAAAIAFNSSARADTAISACGPISSAGNYFLTTNLTTSGTCITITTQRVALDLKGHTITGDGSGDGINDSGGDADYAIIANGKIRNFDRGIYFSNSGLVTVSNIDSSGNIDQGIFIELCCNTLNSVKANSNGESGILIERCCNTLNGIQTAKNSGDGVEAFDCCTVMNSSTSSGNTGMGVHMDGCCNFLTASKTQKNGDDGARLEGCCSGFTGSTSAGNGGMGLSFTSGDNLVTTSKVNSNKSTGIDFGVGSGNEWGVLTVVQANKNAVDGIVQKCHGSLAQVTATGNGGVNLNQDTNSHPCANLNVKAP